MLEIPWIRQSPELATCLCKGYLFKRKKIVGKEMYEVWQNGVLLINDLNYWQVMGKYDAVIYDRIKGETWKYK